MAIGQLLDYQRHVARSANLAVLLPNRPSPDLQDLSRGLRIGAIEEGSQFVAL